MYGAILQATLPTAGAATALPAIPLRVTDLTLLIIGGADLVLGLNLHMGVAASHLSAGEAADLILATRGPILPMGVTDTITVPSPAAFPQEAGEAFVAFHQR